MVVLDSASAVCSAKVTVQAGFRQRSADAKIEIQIEHMCGEILLDGSNTIKTDREVVGWIEDADDAAISKPRGEDRATIF